MNYNPNSKKHKAMHGGYRSKPTKAQVQATLNFFDISDPGKMVTIVATPGQGRTMLGAQLELNL